MKFRTVKKSNEMHDRRLVIIRKAIAAGFKWLESSYPEEIERVARLMYTGLLFGEKGDYSESEKYFYKLVQVHPDLIFAWYAAAKELYPDGLDAKLLAASQHTESIDNVLSIHPTDTRALMMKALELEFDGKTDEAVEYCNKAYRINPDSFWLIWNSIRFQIKKKNKERTIQMMNSFMKIDLKDALSFTKMGQLWSSLEKYSDALACFDRALEIDLRNPAALCGRGICLENLGLTEQALVCFEQSTTVHRHNLIGPLVKRRMIGKLGIKKPRKQVPSKIAEISITNSLSSYLDSKPGLMAPQTGKDDHNESSEALPSS